MRRLGIKLLASLCLTVASWCNAAAPDTAASGNQLALSDGWNSWTVPAVTGAQQWCCYDWNSGVATRNQCDLDKKGSSFGSSDSQALQADSVNLYALTEGGEVKRLKTFSSACEVNSNTAIHQLGSIAPSESLSWLGDPDRFGNIPMPDLIAAIAAHAETQAVIMLTDFARNNAKLETRKQAVFWLAQLRIHESEELLLELMRNDADAELREHAIFSFAHSDADNRAAVLIALIENRSNAYSDRKSALFWLAQMESDEGVDFIQRLLVDK